MEDDSDDLIIAFTEEAREHLPLIEANLLSLESRPNDQTLLDTLFRSVHTIKGGAGFLGFTHIGQLAHSMENLLSLARARKLQLDTTHIDLLLIGADRLNQLIDNPKHIGASDVSSLCQRLNDSVGAPVKQQLAPAQLAPSINQEFKPKETNANNDELIVVTDILPDESRQDKVVENSVAAVVEIKVQASSAFDFDDSDELNVAADELIQSFVEETRDGLLHIEHCLLALEANPADMSRLNELFRYVHTIKGGAYFLGFRKIAELTHIMEDILGLAKNIELHLDEHIIEVLLQGYDCVKQLIELRQNVDHIDIQPLCQQLEAAKIVSMQEPVSDSKPIAAPLPLSPPPVVVVNKTVDEKPAVKVQPDESATDILPTETEESIRVHVKRLNKLIDLAGELVLVRNQIVRVCEPLIPQATGLKVMLHNFNRITTEIQEEIMSTRMQPVGVIFNKFPRLIRQLERDLGKHLDLVTEGADVELDKTIIESLTDPVTHIIRNMADHGIELPEERVKRGKPASGTLLQKAFHESGQVVIQFSDDGAGIDPDFVALKAVQKGIITAEAAEKMSAKEKMHLIFTAGFSTAETVSAVSGRGIGMDVVKTNVEACGGSLDISSDLGKWTSITMTLPLTMAIIAALIVRVQNCRFAFPQGNLDEMVLLEAEDYSQKVGTARGQRLLSLRGDYLPLISLADSLAMPPESDAHDDKPLHILIIKANGNRVAVMVDQILGSEEIVVKPMPDYFKHLQNFSGTSILGDGAIALIIDTQGYIEANHLAYAQLPEDDNIINQRKVEQEPQSLLIFDNNTEEHFALALSWIQRIDTIDVSSIQHVGENEYINYRGEQVRLLRLENCLAIQKPNNYEAIANIIIPKHTQVPVALLINRVIDTRNTVMKLENTAFKTTGILGSMLLDGKITLMLDLHSILQIGEPDSVEKIEINLERTKGKHILLVEDTPFFMRIIREFIVASGYQVTTACNGREGLEILQTGDFDLVLSDIEMPLMDGREMVKNIRANPRWNALPVIALTTLNDANTIAEGKKAGFSDWLVKLDKELVLKTLAQYL